MSGIAGYFVKYVDGGRGTEHELKKYVGFVGDPGAYLAGSGTTIDLSSATPGSAIVNAGLLIRAHCKALERIAPTGSTILQVGADFRTTGGPGVVDATASYDIAGFTPNGGEGKHGPRPIGFVAFEGVASRTHKPGWLRYYSSSALLWGTQDGKATGTFDATFEAWLADISGMSGTIIGHTIWTGASGVLGSWENQAPFDHGHIRLGARNG